MPVFSYQSEALTPQIASSSALRMVLGYHGISLVARQAEKTLALKSWQIPGGEQIFQAIEPELRQIFGAERLLEWPFKEKTCALAAPACTLVPRRLFEPENLSHYFKLLLRDNRAFHYGFEKLEPFDCYLVWAAEPGLIQLCAPYFPVDCIRHLAAPLLCAIRNLAPTEGYAVFANILGQKVQIAVLERQNLVFFNSFDYSKPSDLLYYVLLAYKQFDLNPLDIELTLSGTLIEDSEIFKLLLRYVRPMRFPPLPSGFEPPTEAKSFPGHFWFDLGSI